MIRLTEGRLRQREPDDGGKVQAKGADWPREAKGKGSRLSEGKLGQRDQTDRGKANIKGAD